MKKLLFLCLLTTVTIFSSAQSQERSPFRRGYLRFGINRIPGRLNPAMTPKQNILAFQYGSGTGFVLEMGKAYYFNKPEVGDKIAYGLDGTIFSLTYNPLSKWAAYEAAAGDPNATSSPMIATASTKLGPVLSLNVVENLVIDARVQLAVAASHYSYEYVGSSQYFSLNNGLEGGEEAGELPSVQLGFKPSLGLSVRRNFVGVALDYAPGKVSMNYTEGNGSPESNSYGQQKLRANVLQLKLNIAF